MSQHALLPVCTINTQSVVPDGFIKELSPAGRRGGGELPSEGCLGSAGSCLLSLLPPVERNKKTSETETAPEEKRLSCVG